jgi:hypothetical protein
MSLQGRSFASPLCATQNLDYGLLASQPLTCVLESSLTRIAVPGGGGGYAFADHSTFWWLRLTVFV